MSLCGGEEDRLIAMLIGREVGKTGECPSSFISTVGDDTFLLLLMNTEINVMKSFVWDRNETEKGKGVIRKEK